MEITTNSWKAGTIAYPVVSCFSYFSSEQREWFQRFSDHRKYLWAKFIDQRYSFKILVRNFVLFLNCIWTELK